MENVEKFTFLHMIWAFGLGLREVQVGNKDFSARRSIGHWLSDPGAKAVPVSDGQARLHVLPS